MSLNTMVAAVLMAVASSAVAQTTELPSRPLLPSSRMWIEGGSNVHDWNCRSGSLDGRASVDTAALVAPEGPDPLAAIRGVFLRVPVREFKCGNARMEKDLYRALRADDPATGGEIRASLNAAGRSASSGKPGVETVETTGTVTVAGTAKPVRALITVEHLSDGTIRASGKVMARMTDFGVTPPTGLLGLVRSRDEVVVRFELLIAESATGPRAARVR